MSPFSRLSHGYRRPATPDPAVYARLRSSCAPATSTPSLWSHSLSTSARYTGVAPLCGCAVGSGARVTAWQFIDPALLAAARLAWLLSMLTHASAAYDAGLRRRAALWPGL
jgi:hypothetical protein